DDFQINVDLLAHLAPGFHESRDVFSWFKGADEQQVWHWRRCGGQRPKAIRSRFWNRGNFCRIEPQIVDYFATNSMGRCDHAAHKSEFEQVWHASSNTPRARLPFWVPPGGEIVNRHDTSNRSSIRNRKIGPVEHLSADSRHLLADSPEPP